MKKLVIPSTIEQIKKTLDYSDSYLIGIKDMCVNMNLEAELKDLKTIKKIINDKELFVCLNKNMQNSDINYLKQILLELDSINIKGVFYADTSIVSLYNKLKLKYDLVWSNEHSTTNYNTVNYWNGFNVNYTYLSAEITYDEIIDIKKNTTSKLIVPIFGYLPMFVSKRHIIKNYLSCFSINDSSKINYIEKENNIYPIIDNNVGTVVYSDSVLDGFNYYNKFCTNNIDYVSFNSFNIDDDDFVEVLKIYSGLSKKSVCSIIPNSKEYFLNTYTISKVKKC